MRLSRAYGVGLAVPLILLFAVAGIAGATSPTPITVIHDHKHLANLKQGNVLTYHFKRTASNPVVLGESFADDITLKVTAEQPEGVRDVDLQIYSGDRARELQRMPGRSANPIFLVYFNQVLSTYGRLAGGTSPYLWRAFSDALEKDAKMEPVSFDYDGRKVEGYRIAVIPYAKDVKAAKMEGWENSKFDIVMSDNVPGEVVQMISSYENKHDKALRLEERYTLSGVEGLK
jgi:hypothetical protein